MDFLPCEAEEFKLTFSLSRKCLKSQGLEPLRSLRSAESHRKPAYFTILQGVLPPSDSVSQGQTVGFDELA